jgi:hypothetical protein
MEGKRMKTTPIDDFINEVSDIDETDYGDFMRKANHGLVILMEKIYDSSTPVVKKLLDELKYHIDYMPNWDVDSTREKVNLLAEEIRIATQVTDADTSPASHFPPDE